MSTTIKVTAVNANIGGSTIKIGPGLRGLQGIQGVQGIQGIQGEAGLDGADGVDGVGAPVQTGPFSGEFDVSQNISRFYTDYQSGSVVNLSLSATRVFGSIATVRIRGDFLGTIPSSWSLSGDAVSTISANWNEITVLYVSDSDIRVVNRVYAWSSAPDTTPPSVPTALVSSLIGTTSFTLSWTGSTDNIGVTAYKIYQDGVNILSTPLTTRQITGLVENTTYAMTVSAIDEAGNESAQSSPLNVTTLVASAEQPPVLTTTLAEAAPVLTTTLV